MAQFPTPAGNSSIPNTLPGSTTPNSSIALAGFKDLSDLLDIMTAFNTLYENNLSSVGSNVDYSLLYATSLANMSKIQTEIDTQTVVDTLDYITSQRDKYKAAITAIRNIPSNSDANNSPPSPTMSLSSGTTVTITDIQYAISRAQDEQNRIDNLRSSAPDLTARSQILERVRLALSDLLDKINKGYLTTDNLPFSKTELTQFLSDVSNPSSTITAIPKPPAAQGSSGGTSGGFDPAGLLQQLRSAAQDLTLDLHVSYDPKVTIQRRLLDRLDQLTKDIKSDATSGPELAAKMLEMNTLKQQISTYNRRSIAESANPLQAYQSVINTPVTAPTMLNEAFQDRNMPSMDPTPSNDWNISPGSEITTDTIVHRASASSYTDTQSGPDYKQRAQFLCKQIRGAELGDPKEFGCIADPEHDVGPDYSWRGNYKMVCNRLGNTWGGWYPEMFGCPPSEVATSEVPK